MKTQRFLIAILAAMLLSVLVASAALDAPTNVKLGSDTTRSGTQVSTQVTLTNAANETITGISAQISADAQYQLTLTGVPASLGPGQSATATLQGFMPGTFGGQRSIGSILFTSSNGTDTTTIDMEGRAPFVVKRVRFDIEGRTDSVKDGETASPKAHPGDHIEITVEFENQLDRDDDDGDLDDIEATVTIEGIDDGDDIEKDFDFDLNTDDTHEVRIAFDVPLNTDEDTFTVDIRADGEDQLGNTQRADAQVEFEVEKENHDIRITRFTVSPATVDCSRTISMGVELTNYGQDQEDHVSVGIRQAALGIEFNQFNIELDNDLDEAESKYRKDFRYTIPASVRPGTYSVELTAFNDNDFSAFQVADVKVAACGETPVNTTVTPPAPSPPSSSGSVSAQPDGSSSSVKTPANLPVLLILGALNLVLLVAIIAIVARLMNR